MNWRRIEIEFAPNSLKFNPINNNKNVKKKKNITHQEGYDDDEIDVLLVPPTLFFFKQDKQLLLLRDMMMMMMVVVVVNSSTSSRLKQYLVESIHEKHKFVESNLVLVVSSSDSPHHKFLTQTHDHDHHTDDDDDFPPPPYLLQQDYNNGFIYCCYYQSMRTKNSSGTPFTYTLLCIPPNSSRLIVDLFVNAKGSKLFRSITPPHDYFVKSPNTITSSSTALISTHTTTSIISPLPVNDDWFVFEILTRLPVKTLIRFKTVSKRWCSLIQKDENFINSHLLNRSKTSFRRLFIVNPASPVPRPPKIPRPLPPKINQNNEYYDDNEMFSMSKWHDNEWYITADLILFQQDNNNNNKGNNKGGGDTTTSVATNVVDVVVDTIREVNSNSYDFILNPLNGLTCLIESNSKYAVRIFNISTRELSPWFPSSLLSEVKLSNGIPFYSMRNYPDAEPYYQFGFDPSTNEHKLVCLWDNLSHLICEVLTVGPKGIDANSKWRRIEEVPDAPFNLAKDSVHVNGVFYWSTCLFHHGIWDSKRRPICILAFDVRREKFRTITVPDFILDQPRDDFEGEINPLFSDSYSNECNEIVNLLQVGGCLAMLVRMTNCMFKIYIYEDDDDCKFEEEINRTPIVSGQSSFSSNNNGRWSEAGNITLPFSLGKRCGARFCKFVGSDDEIILTSSEGRNCDKDVGNKKCVSFYLYNWKKSSWREFEVSGIPSSVSHLCTGSYITTFSENLLPVNNDKALF